MWASGQAGRRRPLLTQAAQVVVIGLAASAFAAGHHHVSHAAGAAAKEAPGHVERRPGQPSRAGDGIPTRLHVFLSENGASIAFGCLRQRGAAEHLLEAGLEVPGRFLRAGMLNTRRDLAPSRNMADWRRANFPAANSSSNPPSPTTAAASVRFPGISAPHLDEPQQRRGLAARLPARDCRPRSLYGHP